MFEWRLVQHTDGPKAKGVPNARRENIFRNSLFWIRRRVRCWDCGGTSSSWPARRFCPVVPRNACRNVFARQLFLAAHEITLWSLAVPQTIAAISPAPSSATASCSNLTANASLLYGTGGVPYPSSCQPTACARCAARPSATIPARP